MNSERSLPKLNGLTIFSHAWAAQSLVQLVFYIVWFEEGLILGYIFAALAILVFMFPGRVWLFGAMIVASIAYFVSQWPYVVNHILTDTFLSVTMLAALIWMVVYFRRRHVPFDQDLANAWFDKFAPVCGAAFAFIYFSIIVSKLNTGFFNLDISCLKGMIEEVHDRRPILSPLLSIASVEFYFWFFMVAETLLPLMLAIRKTRLLAFYFGVPFHVLLGLMGHWPFSAFMISLYILVAAPALLKVLREVADWADGLRNKLVPWVSPSLGFACVSGLLLACALVIKPSWVWLIWTLGVATALLYATIREHIRHGLFAGTGVTPMWTSKPGFLWVFFVLVVINSLSPYIGLKTTTSVAMYSNMRTEGGTNNHLFMPRVPLFHIQDDLVEIVDSNNEQIEELKTHPARYGYVGQEFDVYVNYFELRRSVANVEDPDLEITYIRNGEQRTFKRGENNEADPDLDVAPSIFLQKALYFRPVFKGDLSYCLH
ncbi:MULTISPECIES: hypothetical protein [unclassified Roseovarius]|uniref:hypothetical protein n=1 Tax=unclassified Roseovarius TaxID=2614913 RepID=UPI00273D3E40|nr:hypothetical protein [Roseovarius sp. MMSF_3350]